MIKACAIITCMVIIQIIVITHINRAIAILFYYQESVFTITWLISRTHTRIANKMSHLGHLGVNKNWIFLLKKGGEKKVFD